MYGKDRLTVSPGVRERNGRVLSSDIRKSLQLQSSENSLSWIEKFCYSYVYNTTAILICFVVIGLVVQLWFG